MYAVCEHANLRSSACTSSLQDSWMRPFLWFFAVLSDAILRLYVWYSISFRVSKYWHCILCSAGVIKPVRCLIIWICQTSDVCWDWFFRHFIYKKISCVRSVKLNSDGDYFLFSDPCFFIHIVWVGALSRSISMLHPSQEWNCLIRTKCFDISFRSLRFTMQRHWPAQWHNSYFAWSTAVFSQPVVLHLSVS